MQSGLDRSIREAERGFYPLGNLLVFKHTEIRKKKHDNQFYRDEMQGQSGNNDISMTAYSN